MWQIDFDAAIQKRDAGDLPGCLSDLDRLAAENPENAGVAGTRAGVLFELGRFEEAAEGFRRAVELAPKSEIASLGLFHSLNRLCRKDEAKKEMERFQSIRASEEYERIRRETE